MRIYTSSLRVLAWKRPEGSDMPRGAPGLTPDGHENLANVDTSEASRGRIGVDDEVKVLSIDDEVEVLSVDNKVEIHPSCCLLLLFGLPVWPSTLCTLFDSDNPSLPTLACIYHPDPDLFRDTVTIDDVYPVILTDNLVRQLSRCRTKGGIRSATTAR